MLIRVILILVALCIPCRSVQAHFVWLERDSAGAARAYFGEWEKDLHEKTGGALDRIKSPRAFLTDPRRALPVERRDDHLAIATAEPGDIRFTEESLPPREDKREGGKSKTIFYAKGGRSETKAALDLELVPVTANADTLALLWRGAPLAKAEVTVLGPPKWEKPLQTDEQGKVTIQTPWSGRYLIVVSHSEQKAGEAAEEKFDRLRYVFTLSFVVEQGIAWVNK